MAAAAIPAYYALAGGAGGAAGGAAAGGGLAALWPLLASAGGGLLQGIGGGKGSRGARSQVSQRRADVKKYSSAKYYKSLFDNYMKLFSGSLEPARRRVGDAAAMGEQTQLEGVNADYAQHGLIGSGAHLASRGAVGASRQARLNDALTEMYLNVLQNAMGQASTTQNLRVSGLSGVPINTQPSGGSQALSTLGRALSLYGLGNA